MKVLFLNVPKYIVQCPGSCHGYAMAVMGDALSQQMKTLFEESGIAEETDITWLPERIISEN